MRDAKESQAITTPPESGSDRAESVSEKRATVNSSALETDYHLTGSKLFFILAGIGLAIFLFALDISVISTVRLLSMVYSNDD